MSDDVLTSRVRVLEQRVAKLEALRSDSAELTLREVAKRYRCSYARVVVALRTHRLRGVRFGRRWVITADDARAWWWNEVNRGDKVL